MNKDVVEELEELIAPLADGSPTEPILRKAIEEIQRLRAAAGAVSAGPDLATIKEDVKQPKPHSKKSHK